MSPDRTVVVLAKAPVAGRVKTRLCPPLAPETAASLAAASLADTLDTVARVSDAHHVLALDGDPRFPVPSTFAVVAQGGGDLASRIDHALACGAGATVIVGMDTPQLEVGLLTTAFDLLTSHDAVLGPADDGGFWAIGRARPGPPLCAGVPMSSARTAAAARARLDALGMHTALLPTLRDVDEFADAVAVAGEAPATAFARTFARLDLAPVR